MTGLGEWDDANVDQVDEPSDHSGPGQPEVYYDTLDEFVQEMIIKVFCRRIGDRSQFRWAADWWRYPEAVSRLEALWRAWGHLRLDPATGNECLAPRPGRLPPGRAVLRLRSVREVHRHLRARSAAAVPPVPARIVPTRTVHRGAAPDLP